MDGISIANVGEHYVKRGSQLRQRIAEKLPKRRYVRGFEIAGAMLVVLTVLGFAVGATFEESIIESNLLWSGLMFGVPPALGLVAIAGAIQDGLGVSSAIIAMLAVMTIWIAMEAVYVLLFPPEHGGVFFGHLVTLFFGVLLSASIVAREALGRVAGMRADGGRENAS
jgi:hypothetical protein